MEKDQGSNPENIFIFNLNDLYETEVVKKCFNIAGILVVATDLEGKIIQINTKGCELLEYEENEITGKDWIDNFIDDSLRENARVHFEKLIKNKSGSSVVFPFIIKTKSGGKRIIESRTVLLGNKKNQITGLLITGEDVTNFHTMQKELQNLIYQYRTLAGNIPGMNMYLFDKNLRFIIAEGSEMRRYNFSKDEFEGKTIYEVLDGELGAFLIPLYESAISGKEISTEYRYRDNDYGIWLLPLRNSEKEIYGGMAITQNITKEKLVSLNLRKAKELAEESNRAKSSFLASVSHEIRTPLNAIIGFSEQLSKTRLSKQQKSYVDIIDKSSEHLLSLVNEILVLSKIDAGEVYFSEKPFKPSQVIKEVYNALKIKADEKSLNFKYQIDNNEDLILLGDAMRLKEILMNVVNNAVKFTESGFVELKCSIEDQTIEHINLRFDIIDTGIGIPEDKLEEIFDQFKQADSAISKKFGGTGLGLTICKHLVELQNGTISVQSEFGQGSQFTIQIPYKRTIDKDLDIREEDGVDTSALAGLKVLLVDDDSVNRLLGKTILNNFRCEVDIAQDGTEAIEKIKNKKYDIILLDIHMPQVSGIDVAGFIRREMKDDATVIIAVTAAVMKNDIIQYFNIGINDYLIKPFRELNLFNKIHKSIGSRKRLINLYEMEEDAPQNSPEADLFDLKELERIANNDPVFINKMLETFIQNSRKELKGMRRNVKKRDWQQVGEHAHKMLPSFRHLQVKSVISDLVEIKTKTIIKPEFDDVEDLVKKVTKQIHTVIFKLRKEINQAKEKA